MRKILTAAMAVGCLVLAGCGREMERFPAWEPEISFEAGSSWSGEIPADSDGIRFSLEEGAEIIVRLNDNPAADALHDMLPLELTFEEFNGTEKIAYLPEELPTDGYPDSCDPDVGSLCYYIPWGNLCFFYRDFRASSSLIPLGQVESGAEFLERLDLSSGVTAEAAKD